MFLTSTLVPYSVSPLRRTEMFASTRREPSSIRTSLTPRPVEQRAEVGHERARFLGRVDVGLADNLDQRRSRPIEVLEAVGRVVDATGTAHMERLAGVLLEMDARYSHGRRSPLAGDVHVAAETQRKVVLADLIVLGHVRIEVVLAVKERVLSDLAVQREPDLDRVLDRLFVRYRQRPRQAQAYRDMSACWALLRNPPCTHRTSWMRSQARRESRARRSSRTVPLWSCSYRRPPLGRTGPSEVLLERIRCSET